MIQGVFTPDGKYTTLLGDWELPTEVVTSAVRVCAKYDALDLLPMLGVQS